MPLDGEIIHSCSVAAGHTLLAEQDRFCLKLRRFAYQKRGGSASELREVHGVLKNVMTVKKEFLAL